LTRLSDTRGPRLDLAPERVEPSAVSAEAEVSSLLAAVGERDIVTRMRRFAELLLGRPYLAHPLVGSRDRPEELVTGVSGFDCVTFVETVLALAHSETPVEFRDELVRLRYRGGTVAWEERLHYFSEWMLENERRGVLRIDTRGPGSRTLEVRLSILEGLPPRQIQLDVVPKESVEQAMPRFTDGTIAAFASEREGLDHFHVGILFFEEQLMMVHAAKSFGAVGKEPLSAFLARNTTRGISFARPLERRTHS
jgi:hypothetical protein